MRLTQIKLAGFKSFVDPTLVKVPGDLVGVVGPNGCGKSNIIDAVRWVLGESRASALRGDSMQDVIFNGSTQRKPVARASVELIFDNSLGKAAGQWSQYAEISVKRVLTREGESSYHINNTHVRRRDIQDIFMGTGLGPRAYAIIEQGMISRIIEAKPEELRVFLEEAAGISKYKDRRRETENRLSDTRENLSRVGDIRQELGSQIEKLERQAEVARRFNDLSAERQHKQTLLWVLRRQEAEAEEERHHRDVERLTNELEAETARLREIEKDLELARQVHYTAGDTLSTAQGELYNANSEVARLETEIRFVAETRQRLEAQIDQLRMQLENGERQRAELSEAASLWQSRSGETAERSEMARQQLEAEQARLPEREHELRNTRSQLDTEREAVVQSERAVQLEQTNVAHADRILEDLATRMERLQAERAQLVEPDQQALEQLLGDLDGVAAELTDQQARAEETSELRSQIQTSRQTMAGELRELEREHSSVAGRLDALERIQSQVDENSQIHDWIARWQLGAQPRLWQQLRVEEGWDTAVESVLRDRLHAVEIGSPELLQNLLDNPPPAKLTALTPFSFGESAAHAVEPGLKPLAGVVTVLDSAIAPLVAAWLRNVYAIEGIPGTMTRTSLPAETILVTREGHQFGRFSVAFHAPDPADSGILARQREIEALSKQTEVMQGRLDDIRDQLQVLDNDVAAHDESLAQLRAAAGALKQREHDLRLEQMKLVQTRDRFVERTTQITAELADLMARQEAEAGARESAAQSLVQHRDNSGMARERLQQIMAAHDEAANALDAHRRVITQAEREVQEAAFAERECASKIEEIGRMLQTAVEATSQAADQLEILAAELGDLHDEGMKEQLQAALEVRVGKEARLTEARSLQDEAASTLRSLEDARLSTEQKLQPLRDCSAELRLKEQAAHLSMEQFATQLAEAGVDDATAAQLMAEAREGQKASSLQGEITRLNAAISDLGAINMAALEELQTSQERKTFLDAQAEDLNSALETLENAIRKIDRETRELLQVTFDTVNGHFGQLFPALFGGGEARLTMSGEEVLDSGVVVTARPPGKKNSTIHLLSGGEKALTAIALVFSFFQLNPAPFCLLDEVDAPLDDANTLRFCDLVSKMARQTQFLYISHNKIAMEMATHLVGVTMQEQGVSRVVEVDMDEALKLQEPVAA